MFGINNWTTYTICEPTSSIEEVAYGLNLYYHIRTAGILLAEKVRQRGNHKLLSNSVNHIRDVLAPGIKNTQK